MTSRTLIFLSLLGLGCGTEDASGEGELDVVAYGESFIEEGIPASEMDDGWAIDFSSFSVTLSAIQVAGDTLNDTHTVELTTPSAGAGQLLDSLLVPTGDYTDAGFTVSDIRVVGSATDGSVTKTFDWSLGTTTTYVDCEPTTSVAADSISSFQITIHADHLFYDSLVSEEPGLRFQRLADADTDDDGVITAAELEAADIGDYDPGSEGEVSDLWNFLRAQSQTVGHADGEGHCHLSDS